MKLVSFTVDPAHDTPAVLAEYGKHFGAKPGVWFFLTGPEDALHHLSRDVFMLGDIDGNWSIRRASCWSTRNRGFAGFI